MQPARRSTLGPAASSVTNVSTVAFGGGFGSKTARASMGPARMASSAGSAAFGSGSGLGRASLGAGGGSGIAFSSLAAAASGGGSSLASGRPSLGAPPVHRRSSAGRSGKDDPRPIGTGAFTREQCDVLITFLMERQYDRDISLKLLKSPTATEFENIFVFLARQFDPSFHIRDKVTNDVPELLKLLKYPVSLSKTALVAVGTQHNWPNCLAALTWMVELLNYSQLYMAAERDESSGDSRMLFFTHLTKSYAAFLCGDTDMTDALENELASNFASQKQVAQAGLQTVQDQIGALNASIEALESRESSLPGLQEKAATYEGDVDKFEQLIQQLTTHQTTLRNKSARMTAEKAELDDTIASTREQLAQLRYKRENQTITAADAKRMKAERGLLVEQLTAAEERKRSGQLALHEAELAFQKGNAELKAKVAAFNQMAESVAREKKTDKERVREVKRNVTLSVQFTEGSKATLVPDKDVVRDSLRALKGLFAHFTTEFKAEAMELQEKADASSEALSASARGTSHVHSQLAQAEEALRSEREALERELAAATQELQAVGARTAEARAALTLTTTAAKEVEVSAVAKLVDEFKREKASQAREREALHSEIVQAMTQLTAHVAYVQSKLSDAKQDMQDRKASLESRS